MNIVLSRWSNVSDSTSLSGWYKDAVISKETVFVDFSDDISLTEDIAFLQFLRLEGPYFFGI
jgi:hypothetical protein